jgi:hypothetical protein
LVKALGLEPRTPCLKGRDLTTLTERATEVDRVLKNHRSRWLIGAAAVIAAVNGTSGEDVELAA